VPRKNKGGGKPPQGPRVDQRELEAIAKALEAVKPDFARALGLTPEEYRRYAEQMRRHQELLEASFPPQIREFFKALERERRAKLAAEAEAAAQEAARQARRARRKGVGGRSKAMTADDITAAKAELRHHPKFHDKKEAALTHLKTWFERQGKNISRGSLQRDVVWPVLGRRKRR
jgi:hypothetical protein